MIPIAIRFPSSRLFPTATRKRSLSRSPLGSSHRNSSQNQRCHKSQCRSPSQRNSHKVRDTFPNKPHKPSRSRSISGSHLSQRNSHKFRDASPSKSHQPSRSRSGSVQVRGTVTYLEMLLQANHISHPDPDRDHIQVRDPDSNLKFQGHHCGEGHYVKVILHTFTRA